jgi:hypothetical protein
MTNTSIVSLGVYKRPHLEHDNRLPETFPASHIRLPANSSKQDFWELLQKPWVRKAKYDET